MRLALTLILPGALAIGCGDTPAPADAPKSATSAASTTATSAPAAATPSAAAQSAATLSPFDKYRRKSMTSEAVVNLRMMVDGATAYYASEHATAEGVILPPQLPPNAGLQPPKLGCTDGKPTQTAIDPKAWRAAGWAPLNFQPMGPVRYQYAWVTDGKTFTARAIGDLDCDGVTSTFEEYGAINAEGDVQRDPKSPRKVRPLE